jgi:hypothetical protein
MANNGTSGNPDQWHDPIRFTDPIGWKQKYGYPADTAGLNGHKHNLDLIRAKVTPDIEYRCGFIRSKTDYSGYCYQCDHFIDPIQKWELEFSISCPGCKAELSVRKIKRYTKKRAKKKATIPQVVIRKAGQMSLDDFRKVVS